VFIRREPGRDEFVLQHPLKTDAAHELIAPATVGGRDADSRFQLTVGVEDVDAVCGELQVRGIELLNGPMDGEWGVLTAAFTDPDGHIWEVAASLPASA
jgi:catechol 2,3-dioxygenase-like lactoylglutathione lyase family enzyme